MGRSSVRCYRAGMQPVMRAAKIGLSALMLTAIAITSSVVVDRGGSVEAAGGQYAAWTVSGANPSWSGTMTVPVTGFPAASFTTNSNTPSTPSSATLGAGTPFGAKFGSSSGQQYLSFRAGSGGTSTTTFTFESPTPASGWGFALGDIDAEAITVSAVGPDGPLSASQLGWQGAFNYAGAADQPVWDPVTGTLSGNGVDTNGASGWFMPTAKITTLTLNFANLVGFPIAQMWVAATTASISGTVNDITPSASGPSPGNTIQLFDANAELVDTATTGSDGSYTFGEVVPATYTVKIIPAGGLAIVGQPIQVVDVRSVDVNNADFEVAVPPLPTTVTITGPDSAPVNSSPSVTGIVIVTGTPPDPFTGAVTITGLGSCTTSAFTPVMGESNQFGFSCTVNSTEPGEFKITASYVDSVTPIPTFGSSAASATITFVGSADPTTTTITSTDPNPSVVGSTYTVAGLVSVSATAPVGSLPGVMTITGDGVGCSDSSLLATSTSGLYSFTCLVVSSVLGAVTLTATYTDVSGFFGTSTATASHQSVAAPPVPPTPPPPPVPALPTAQRIDGSNRIQTAIAVSERYFGPDTRIVYVATDAHFADALVAGPPAGIDRAPILLTTPNALPADVAAEIRRLGPQEIVIVGGTAAVSTTVEAELATLAATVTRIGGVDRYATATQLAQQRVGGSGGLVYVATGLQFADALAAGVPAGRDGVPILLVAGDVIPATTTAEIERRRASAAIVVGGEAAVAPNVVEQIRTLVANVERVGGADRYATAAAMARLRTGSARSVVVATGENFPDALGAVPAAIIAGSALLLTRQACLPSVSLSELVRLRPARVTVVGGAAAVGQAVMSYTECA
jgi:putative cell wall-binding protein